MDPELDRAYRATRYEVTGANGAFVLRVDQPNAELAAQHAAAGVSCSVFLTACNPRSTVLTDAENARRNAALLLRLQAGGWPHLPAATIDPAGRWPVEAGFLVLGLTRAEGMALAAQFGQNAILVAAGEPTPRLVWCTPPATGPGSSAGSDRPAGPGTGPSGS